METPNIAWGPQPVLARNGFTQRGKLCNALFQMMAYVERTCWVNKRTKKS
jgi:hypothetical protein